MILVENMPFNIIRDSLTVIPVAFTTSGKQPVSPALSVFYLHHILKTGSLPFGLSQQPHLLLGKL